ncbi:adenylate/guanylate cyclase domain-containing protein [[Leptolyngbya] sp. PCC 7376]|uniref:adenylate/guanylate cyclase domain-containing protein n=1 Tax=[Leptolyngbya] sp. PCC 7376 TaxID=111781 RepID=UPI0002ECE918|nr:adenylate/guanylate cyclase domain-containing protein [[Leptolyngbya] sp. PCC 7376]
MFNIWYNVTRVQPLLTPTQQSVLTSTILFYNVLIYPLAIACWIGRVRSLGKTIRALKQGKSISEARLHEARKQALNLPWLGTTIAAIAWFLCIPVFLGALLLAPDDPNPNIFLYLPVSITISALIAITQSFFAIELSSQQKFYPILFRNTKVAESLAAHSLSLYERGFLVVVSVGICPIISLLLLLSVPPPSDWQNLYFALVVGLIGIGFGFISAWMLGRTVVEPVMALKKASQAVMMGDLTTRINLKRADEFGPLIDEFNQMVAELEEKQYLRDMFGRHVGQGIAQQILQSNPELVGTEQNLTVMFTDIRNFTARSAISRPSDIVLLLNRFLNIMVEIVEQDHHGMVNQLLGDGFMALFGVGDTASNHAEQAVNAAQDMMRGLERLNQELIAEGIQPLQIGIGLHTGLAIAGSIGSPQRMEYTAVGDTVNVASRVESLTKVVGKPLVFSGTTKAALPKKFESRLEALEPQMVKGKSEPIEIYTLK